MTIKSGGWPVSYIDSVNMSKMQVLNTQIRERKLIREQ